MHTISSSNTITQSPYFSSKIFSSLKYCFKMGKLMERACTKKQFICDNISSLLRKLMQHWERNSRESNRLFRRRVPKLGNQGVLNSRNMGSEQLLKTDDLLKCCFSIFKKCKPLYPFLLIIPQQQSCTNFGGNIIYHNILQLD